MPSETTAMTGNATSRLKPVILAILDGWGIAPNWGGNAISLAKTPFMNMATQTYPNTILKASGEAVGLPAGNRGNSEVGHLTIGAGQVVMESLPLISTTIKDGSFFHSEALMEAFTRAKSTGHTVHIMGLVSDGGIHSHINHLVALIDMAEKLQSTNVCIHAITDGRDTAPFVAQEYLSQINTYLREKKFGSICTVAGRYYSMDRDHRWDRIEKSYRAMTEGVGLTAQSPEGAVAAAYRAGFSDEFIQPTVIQGEGNTYKPIADGDSLIFFNFRGDRAREITQAFVKEDFDGFKRKKVLKDLYFVGFGYYQEGLPIHVAFSPKDVTKP
ncbi:MAG TPA: 2,3-bisphosphoglycerate-independent phosphoglycerate mutase, partial [Candidatus Saccharimonadales bacterium]|nr:2,3-bisphosphoglycerate-independent phosphoglycerate mutase [Candidatus Saccharimonadales bacterium]